MAFGGDALCGPSNALKSFSDRFEHDRSLTQDRLTTAHHAGPSTFKSVSDPSTNGDYRAFVANGSNGLPPLPMGHHSLPLLPGAPMQQQLGGVVIPTPPSQAAVPGGDQSSFWAAEFQDRLNPFAGVRRPTIPTQLSPVAQVAPVRHQSPPAAQTLTRPYVHGPMPFPSYSLPLGAEYDPFVDHMNPPALLPAGLPAAQNYGGMSEAELEASFAKFEAYEEDFETEMDTWMAQHGPRAEQQQRQIDQTMERLADDLDQAHLRGDAGLFAENTAVETTQETSAEEQRAQDTDLSRTAAQIVDSVADTSATNDKFKNSAFLNLMRRVASADVVLRNDDLVDATTGQSATSVSEPARLSSAAATSSSAQNWWTGDMSSDKGKGKATTADSTDQNEQQSPSH